MVNQTESEMSRPLHAPTTQCRDTRIPQLWSVSFLHTCHSGAVIYFVTILLFNSLIKYSSSLLWLLLLLSYGHCLLDFPQFISFLVHHSFILWLFPLDLVSFSRSFEGCITKDQLKENSLSFFWKYLCFKLVPKQQVIEAQRYVLAFTSS